MGEGGRGEGEEKEGGGEKKRKEREGGKEIPNSQNVRFCP